MIGTIVTPMTRGQITLPKAYRDKLGITSETPLNITLEEDKIVVKPLTAVISDMNTRIVKSKYTKEECLKQFQKMIKNKNVLWTKADDQAKKEMEAKEKRW